MKQTLHSQPLADPIGAFADTLNDLPVTIASTSYVRPGGYLENVRMLASTFRAIQLVMYEPFDRSPLDPAELEGLQEFRRDGLSYVIHLPVPGRIGVPDSNAVTAITEVIRTLKPLDPTHYVLHVDTPDSFDPALASAGVFELIERTGTEPEKICVENLIDFSFDKAWDAVKNTGVSACIDVGHLLVTGGDPFAFIDRYGHAIRMAHLHGVVGTDDHRSLRALDPTFLQKLFRRFAGMNLTGPVVIENFSEEEMLQSLLCLKNLSGTFAGQRA